jgi:translation initiation factor IF-3
VNKEIRAPEVRLIDADGKQLGVVNLRDAIQQAEASGLDLVEISPTASPPVCRLIDYDKFRYQQEKRVHAAKKKQKKTQVKEVKFRPTIEEGDYQVKLRNLVRFLEAGDKVKVSLRFRGRELSHQELGRRILERLCGDVASYGDVELRPKLEGRQLVMIVAPVKTTTDKS